MFREFSKKLTRRLSIIHGAIEKKKGAALLYIELLCLLIDCLENDKVASKCCRGIEQQKQINAYFWKEPKCNSQNNNFPAFILQKFGDALFI